MQLMPLFFAFSLMPHIHRWRAKLGGDFHLLVFVGSFAVVTLVVFWWALSFRDPTRKPHHRHRPKPAAEPEDEARGGGFFSRQRHKHRRRKHRPINPTRAETGGLPPARDPKTPPKSPL